MERRRQARWDLANLHSVGTKFTPRQYAMLRRACDLEGISVYALTKRLLSQWLFEWAEDNPDRVKDIVL